MSSVLAPREPESIEETGLSEAVIEQLILKILYFRGELYGRDLSKAAGLKFSVTEGVVEALKLRHHVQVKRSLGMGNVGAVLALTDAGRDRARECLEGNQYSGPAPVPLAQYAAQVCQQRPREGWLTRQALARAFSGMVLTEHILAQVGPAVSSANSLLVHGQPGDGKTLLIESLANLESAPVFVPHAIECQGNIVQVFDPIFHTRLEEEAPSVTAVSHESGYDRRWAKCRRPFIVSGGELTLDMLDLRYNGTSKIYEAPFQLKANNGIYLVDDFGRQRAAPAEVLNRWIVPMERRVDYLSFLTGGKMMVPFEAFLVFSTNLNPRDLGDEAFLRRIQYKMLMRGPAENEFIRIFETFCAARKLPCPRDLITGLIERHYRQTGKAFRRCHPRDVLTHALDLIQFEKRPMELSGEILDRAFESCFLQEREEASADETIILPMAMKSCSDYWGDQLAQIHTAFETLAYVAGFRGPAGNYGEPASEREFGETETARVLARLHERAFRDWRNLDLHQQSRDLGRYLTATETNPVRMALECQELARNLTPRTIPQSDAMLFTQDLATVLEAICRRMPAAMPRQEAAPAAVPIERSA